MSTIFWFGTLVFSDTYPTGADEIWREEAGVSSGIEKSNSLSESDNSCVEIEMVVDEGRVVMWPESLTVGHVQSQPDVHLTVNQHR